jgi:Flp pilus assembly protein TadG
MRMMKSHFKRLVRDERGANAVLIALLIVPMMGIGALALDISAQHAERTQLQWGADAAALAVAAACAKNVGTCTSTTAMTTANGMIAANGGTPVAGAAEIELLKLSADPAIPNKVRVAAAAEFPHFLESLIDGDDDPNNTTVKARATAVWGTPTGGTTIPLAIAECELDSHFSPGTEVAGDPFILQLIGPGSSPHGPADCGPGYPGGFGWLEGEDIDGDGSADCEVLVEVGVPEPGVPGKSDTKAGGCPDDYISELIGTTVLIPLYDAYTPGTSGSSGSYTISRFAAFRITGYHIASGKCVSPNIKVGGGNCYLPGEETKPVFSGEFGVQGYFLRYVAIGVDFDLGTAPGGSGGLVIAHLTD